MNDADKQQKLFDVILDVVRNDKYDRRQICKLKESIKELATELSSEEFAEILVDAILTLKADQTLAASNLNSEVKKMVDDCLPKATDNRKQPQINILCNNTISTSSKINKMNAGVGITGLLALMKPAYSAVGMLFKKAEDTGTKSLTTFDISLLIAGVSLVVFFWYIKPFLFDKRPKQQ